jgi:thiamine transport system substrate-binding protein
LTVVESWSTGYGLFTSGEAPMVLSYSSSPAYHVEYEGTTRYQALIFDEGHPVQIEGAGLVKGSDNLEAGKLFLDFLLSQTSQEAFALSNIMFPVIEDTPLPESFAYALKSDKIITPHVDQEQLDIAIEEWLEIMGE